jgi:hypothetical protein
VRALIASLACAAALCVAAIPAGAAPIGGRFDPKYTPSMQPQATTDVPVVHELHTVIRERDAGRALAFVLSGVAILIAGGAAAFTVVTARRVAGRPMAESWMRAFLVTLFALAMFATATGCGSSGGASTARQTHATTTRAKSTARPAAPAETFLSKADHFRVALTKDWSESDATERWDGSQLPGISSPTFARFSDPTTGRTLLVATARPAKGMKLSDWRAAMVHAAPAVCDESRSAKTTTLGGEPALAWTSKCSDGYQVNKLAALHGSHGYVVLLPSLAAAGTTDAENLRVFESMRRSFRFTRW